MTETTIINKYRPRDWDEVVGHAAIVAVLKRAINGDTRPHSYLFTGPAGVGKTTMARIAARALDAELVEIDAASFGGVDDMRQIVELGGHMALTGSGVRMFVIDECHTLSSKAWQALLKITEEPPEHLYFALCTTEPGKVPVTIKSRCFHASLNRLKISEIADLLDAVTDAEGWIVDPNVTQLVLEACDGSARQALSLMEKVWDAPSKEEASRIISLAGSETDPLIDICKILLQAPSWPRIQPLLASVEDDAWEHAGIVCGRYLSGAMVQAKSETEAQKVWTLVNALTFPTETYDRKVHFHAAIGRIFWGD